MTFGLAAFAQLPFASQSVEAKSIEEQIRDVATQTLTGLTTTGSNIFASRVHNIEDIKLPALLLYTKNIDSEIISIKPRRIEKNITLSVEGYVKQNTNFDNKIDDIAEEVEEALFTNRLLDNLAKDSFLIQTAVEYESEGEKPLARIIMDFNVKYHHSEGVL